MGTGRSRSLRVGIAGAMLAAYLCACERTSPAPETGPQPVPPSQPSATRAANAVPTPAANRPAPLRILIYSRTTGFRHDSIEAGVAAIERLGIEPEWRVAWTEDPTVFTDDHLAAFDVVVFLSTTGDVLGDDQQAAFERFIAAGKGYVGIHAAADTEYDWPWYGGLVGAYFKGHPAVQQAQVVIENAEHPSMRNLPEPWVRSDEWYDYRTNPGEARADDAGGADAWSGEPTPRMTILARVLETTYEGGGMGEDHPIAWCREYAGGRSWYTGGGHTIESFSEPAFLKHLAGGIMWAGGQD